MKRKIMSALLCLLLLFALPVNALAADPVGNLEEVSSDRVKGWAYQPDLPDTPIQTHIYIKNNLSGSEIGYALFADQYRPDLYAAGIGNGYHAFEYDVNWCNFISGSYNISAYGIQANGGAKPHLANSPTTFTVQPASGTIDEIATTFIRGWAWKSAEPNTAIQVHLYVRTLDGQTVYAYPVFADQYRPDLYAAGYGNGNHGYSIPIDWSTLPEENLRVTLYAVDDSGENPAFYDGYYDNRKQISLLGMVDENGFDFSTWSRQEEINGYCQNIGCTSILKNSIADDSYYTSAIRDSSYCLISTHGSKTGIQWSMRNIYHGHNNCNSSCRTCFGSYDITDLNALADNYFEGTRCVVLMACSTAAGGETDTTNFANALKNKGVTTVVGFKKTISFVYYLGTTTMVVEKGSQRWATQFTKALSEGKSVNDAAKTARDDIVDLYGQESLVNWGLNEENCCIVGDKYQVVKH